MIEHLLTMLSGVQLGIAICVLYITFSDRV